MDGEDDDLDLGDFGANISSTFDRASYIQNALDRLGSAVNAMDNIRFLLGSRFGEGTQFYC